MSTQTERVRIELTADQQDQIFYATGVNKRPIELTRRQLSALTLAAAAAGVNALPVSRSEVTIRSMLASARGRDEQEAPFVITIALSTQQQERLFELTGRHLQSLLLAPDEWQVRYHEDWSSVTDARRIARSFVIVPANAQHAETIGTHAIRLPQAHAGGEGVFGTGDHNATKLAADFLEDNVRPGDRVLDVGTGSGILAIAAARLGAAEVVAVDIDPACVAMAREAAALNDLASVIHVSEGTLDHAEGLFDLVVMNIFPKVLIALAPGLPARLRSGGIAILSGMVIPRASSVAQAVEAAGLEFVEQRSKKSWTALRFRRL